MATINGAIAGFGRHLRPEGAFVAGRLRRLIRRWMTVRYERLELAELDDRLLRDIGIDRIGALREAERPFWDAQDRPRQDWR